MVALSASRLVCSAIAWMRLTTSPILAALAPSPSIAASLSRVSAEALLTESEERPTTEPIQLTQPAKSQAALATVCTLREVDCDTASALLARSLAADATLD